MTRSRIRADGRRDSKTRIPGTLRDFGSDGGRSESRKRARNIVKTLYRRAVSSFCPQLLCAAEMREITREKRLGYSTAYYNIIIITPAAAAADGRPVFKTCPGDAKKKCACGVTAAAAATVTLRRADCLFGELLRRGKYALPPVLCTLILAAAAAMGKRRRTARLSLAAVPRRRRRSSIVIAAVAVTRSAVRFVDAAAAAVTFSGPRKDNILLYEFYLLCVL